MQCIAEEPLAGLVFRAVVVQVIDVEPSRIGDQLGCFGSRRHVEVSLQRAGSSQVNIQVRQR